MNLTEEIILLVFRRIGINLYNLCGKHVYALSRKRHNPSNGQNSLVLKAKPKKRKKRANVCFGEKTL